jgi:hypothetical protein
MKNRKELPRLGYLENLPKINIEKLCNELNRSNLLNYDLYTDIKVSANSKHKDFVISNEFCKNSFFKEDEAESLEGDRYVQLYLTDFDESLRSDNVSLRQTNIFNRTRRLNPNNKNYLPEADELNYGIRNKYVNGMLEDIINLFESKITRVRLACLKANFEIKPHVDYDPSYITRYHIPIITNDNVKMYLERNNNIIEYVLPADGKIYFFNSGLKHWVKNNSDKDRLHLIVDVHGQQELNNLKELVF